MGYPRGVRSLRVASILLLASALYLGLGLFAVYPAWLDGSHGVVGDWQHPDMISNHWMYRWVADRIAAGDWAGLLHNDRYYFPIGDSPVLAGNGSDAVLFGPLAGRAPWPGSVTAWTLAILTLNGLGGLVLAKSSGSRWPGAVFAGSVLALSPYLAHELSGLRLAQVPLYPLAFFLAAWMTLLNAPAGRRRLLWGLAAGLLYALTALLYWYYGLWAALAGVLLFAFRPQARVLPAFLGAALPPVIAVLALFARHWDQIPGATDEPFPHPLAIESGLPISFPLFNGSVERHEIAVSLVFVGLALLGAWHQGKAGLRAVDKGLLLVAAVFLGLSWGPELLLPNGQSTGIPGPFRLLYGLHPALQRFWWPYRHAVLVILALLPFAARGLDALVDRILTRVQAPLARGLAAGALVLVAVYARAGELDFRGARLWAPSSWWEPPAAYEKLGKLPGPVILELPLAPSISLGQQSLSYQWVHHKQLVNGHAQWVDRVRPDAWDAWVAGNSFLAVLQKYESGQLFEPFAFRPEDVVALRQAGIRHIVLNAEYYPRALYPLVPAYRSVLTELFGEPDFQFREQLFAWDLEAYRFKGLIQVPDIRLPPDIREHTGDRAADTGHNRPLGWRELARVYPPALPTDQLAPPPGGMDPPPGAAPGEIAPTTRPRSRPGKRLQAAIAGGRKLANVSATISSRTSLWGSSRAAAPSTSPQPAGKGQGVQPGVQLPLRLGPGQGAGQRDLLGGQHPAHRVQQLRIASTEFRQGVEHQAALAARRPRRIQPGPHHLLHRRQGVCCGREAGAHATGPAALIVGQAGQKEAALVAKGVVEALPTQARGPLQIGHRRRIKALGPEDLGRALQHIGLVEAPGSSSGHGPSFCPRTIEFDQAVK